MSQSTEESFKDAYQLLVTEKFKKIVSVSESISSSYRFQFFRDNIGSIKPVNLKNNANNLRRQDIQKSFYLDGSFYLTYVKSFLEKPFFLEERTGSIVSNLFSSFEIDDINDFILMEAIFKHVGIPFR